MTKTYANFLKIPGLLIFVMTLTACQGMGEFAVRSMSHSSQSELEIPPDDAPDWNDDVVEDPDEEIGGVGGEWEGLSICSTLDFSGLDWAPSLEVSHRDAFALALNITGSFEGVAGWQNLTGNFDGQGISMGLLQQNLGQGSLQPIWNLMFSRYSSQFTQELTSSQVSSVRGMLDRWNSYSSSATLDITDYGYNELDDPEKVAEALGVNVEDILLVTSALTARNQESVNWAKANVLSGTSIKTDWSTRLKRIATSQGYRSLQAEKAEVIHHKALDLFRTYNMTQLRSYLVFFDIVVQNGSIPAKVYNSYQTWLKSNTNANEYTRMKKLIELRVAEALPQWQADVRARKMTLLDGTGVVHGSRRDVDKEYCANIQEPLPN